jgi:hypothetical protein
MSDNTTTLFLHGFPRDMEKQARIDFILKNFAEFDETLQTRFEADAQNSPIKIIENRDFGGLKNFCFVDVEFSAAKKAMSSELNGYKFDGDNDDTLTISIAKPKEPRNDNFNRNDRNRSW